MAIENDTRILMLDNETSMTETVLSMGMCSAVRS